MRILPISRRSSLATGLLVAGAAAGIALAARAFLRYSRKISLRDRVAVVTGGSTGIGLAIARQLGLRGARVAICARHEADLRAAQEQLHKEGITVVALPCDVTKTAQVDEFLTRVRHWLGPVEILVNCAGTITVGPQSHMHFEDYNDVMATNFFGPLTFMLKTIPHMREHGQGRIVNIASFGGKVPAPHFAPYNASKFALVGLSESLRTELLDDGVFVTTVCPGLVRSGSTPHAQFKGQHEKEKALFWTLANTPVLTISPDRLAKKIVNALEHGDAELISPWVARMQSTMHGVLPGVVTDAAALVNGLMPSASPNSHGDQSRSGAEVDADPYTSDFIKQQQAKAEAKYQHKSRISDL